MLSLVERFICATFFSYALFRILTSTRSNHLKTMFTKKHSEHLAVSSFASLCLRIHPLLTFIIRSKWRLILFCFFKNLLGEQNARQLKDALVTTGMFSINFCSNQSKCAKRSKMFHSHSHAQADSI